MIAEKDLFSNRIHWSCRTAGMPMKDNGLGEWLRLGECASHILG
ncbi:MAG: hypothetical protein U9N54_05825 [candidate division Zixibacteria bacterium]|nr:hypothetical protein [candidate division Zixibacteria bacterium]